MLEKKKNLRRNSKTWKEIPINQEKEPAITNNNEESWLHTHLQMPDTVGVAFFLPMSMQTILNSSHNSSLWFKAIVLLEEGLWRIQINICLLS